MIAVPKKKKGRPAGKPGRRKTKDNGKLPCTSTASSRTRSGSYGARPVKRKRRSKVEIDRLRDRLHDIVEEHQPATVRQAYYLAVTAGLIGKTEAEYKAISRLLTSMRLDGSLPFGWITDLTRWMRKPDSYSGLSECLARAQELYRRDLWSDQPAYVEIWLEKDALSGVVYDVTEEWDVPLMVTRGYSSLSFLFAAAQAIKRQGKPVYLYHFGDFDPSGVDIPRATEARLRELAPAAEIHFERVAVTPKQIEELDLPTRPTKTTDSRSSAFVGDSVELDSLQPELLRNLVRDCIERHIDKGKLERTKLIEELERDTLEDISFEHFCDDAEDRVDAEEDDE